ncbi:hypothetical protein I3843_05G056800 [Carya illinoinensis]|nr:hypothetical protein I3843_05G056800 [Carya illinoinensis]
MSVSGEVQPSDDSLPHKLNSKTSFLGLKLYFVIGILLLCAIAAFLAIFIYISLNKKSRKRKMRVKHSSGLIPLVSKEIVEIKSLNRDVISEKAEVKISNADLNEPEVEVEIKGGKRSRESEVSVSVDPENIGWGRWYSLKELEMATHGFAVENVIGEGGYGIVYRGILQDGSVVAVKNLLNNKGQAEKAVLVAEY